MAIDLGSEFMKVAIVKPGVPMEVALDSESSRKTPTVVTLRKDERLFGGAALNMAVKFPSLAYQYIPMLLGKSTKHPDVQQFMTNFPYYKITDDLKNGQLVFHHDEKETTFTAEEIMSMLLEKAKETAEKHAGFPIKSAVITVPPYFTQASRRALLRAASHCDLTVLQLMTHGNAVALNYGVFRFKSFNASSQIFMFYDMGANAAIATIVEYKIVMHKEHGMAEETPQLTILGVGYDTKLGTVPLASRVRDYLAIKFNELGKTPGKDVRSNPRAMAKLFREAMRVIRVLSANQNTFAQVENVMDDIDMKVQVTRTIFEEICADLFERVAGPINQAVQMAEIPIEELKEVILMGGGTRIPKVQELLLKSSKKSELGKGINSDEAAALGAVYQAAALSPGFRVKRFLIRDGCLFPIHISFPKADAEELKLINRTVFLRLSDYPRKKTLTFNKHVDDFTFHVYHGEMDYLNEEQNMMVDKNLSSVHLKGVNAIYKKHMPKGSETPSEDEPKVEAKGIKAHFELNVNGIFQLTSVEAMFEKTKPVPKPTAPKNDTEDPTTLEKLGSTISNLFSSNEGEGNAEDAAKKTETGSTSDSGTTTSTTSKTESATNPTAAKNTAAVPPPPPPPKPELVRETIDFVVVHHDASIPSERHMKSSSARIKRLREQDIEKRALEKSRNELEAFIFEMRDRISQEDYEKTSTSVEREGLSRSVNEVSDWYDESGIDTTKKEFENKLSVLKNSMKELELRVREMRERPKAFTKLKDMLNHTEIMYGTLQNFSGEGNIFTATEIQVLRKLIDETQTWMKNKVAEAESMSLTAKPLVTLDDISLKTKALEREVKYLINKLDIRKSNPPPTKDDKSKTSEKNKTKTEETGSELPTAEDTPKEKSESKVDTSEKSTTQSQETDEKTEL
jgi:hypoxia up-regulated 1